MNKLTTHKQIQVVTPLVEGASKGVVGASISPLSKGHSKRS
jgi:hypothetical protein